MLARLVMYLPPLPRKLTFYPTPLSLRQAHLGSDATVVLLDGDMTFADFWPHFDQPCQGRTLPDPEARRLVRQLLRRGHVARWQSHADDAWAVAHVHEALCELRLAGVTSSALGRSDKLEAQVALLRAYEEVLQVNHWVDAADRQRLAVLQVAQGTMPPALREVERVEVMPGTELLGARLDVLRVFAARGMPVRVHMPWDHERPHAFAWTEALLHALETLGHPNMSISFARRHGRGALRPIVAALCSGHGAEGAPVEPAGPATEHAAAATPMRSVVRTSDVGRQVTRGTAGAATVDVASPFAPVVVRCAPAGLRHAEAVAAQVAAWLSADVPAQAIAVVVPQASMTTEVVRALHGADIPCAHPAQRSLARSRIARLYLASLRAQAGEASGAWWAELWETCGTTVYTPSGAWRPGRVVRALRRAGLATERHWTPHDGLAQALPAPCAAAVAEAMKKFCEPLTRIPENGTLTEMAPAVLRWAQALVRAWPTQSSGAKGPTPAPVTGHRHPRATSASRSHAGASLGAAHRSDSESSPATPALLEETLLGAAPLCDVESSPSPAPFDAAPRCGFESSSASLDAALQGDAEAATLLQQSVLDAVQGEAATDDTWTRQQVADWLEAWCGEQMFLAVPCDPQGVQVLRPEDAVGGRFRRMLFAGADMEAFPRPLLANPFLPEAARIAVNGLLGPRLLQYAPTLGRGALPAVARDVWLWIEMAATVSEQWVVTLQQSSGEAMLGPSELVDDLMRVAGVGMSAAPPGGCIDATVPKSWVPRLWAADPELLAAPMQQSDCTLAARLARRWHEAGKRATRAQVPQAVAATLRRYVEQTVHSASRMDVLGMCAFRYVAAAIWGLATDEEAALGATPREQGSAAHAALHQIYDAIMRQGGMRQARLAPRQALDAAHQVMTERAGRILAETQVHTALQPALLAETAAAAMAQLTRDLASPVAHEPVALEYTFDDRHLTGPEALCVQHPRGQGQVRVRGSIDRVDVASQDLWVLDYKRTVRPRPPDRHFQLALYAAIALRDLFPKAARVRVGWAGLRPAKIHWASDLPDTPEGLMAHLQERLFARIDPVAQGHFSPDPDAPSTCERCDFRRLCRLDDREAPATCGPPSSLEPPYA